MANTPTPRPWFLSGEYCIRGPQDPDSRWQRGTPVVARVRANQEYRSSSISSDNHDKANAALIVSCVNALDGKNPEALKEFVEATKEMQAASASLREVIGWGTEKTSIVQPRWKRLQIAEERVSKALEDLENISERV